MPTPEATAGCRSGLREAGKVLDLSADIFIQAESCKACLDKLASRVEEATPAGPSLSIPGPWQRECERPGKLGFRGRLAASLA
jgi:hypothetical protein